MSTRNIKERMNKCSEVFSELAKILSDQYEILESCNKDFSKYLCLKGTTGEVSYEGKPEKSFRISDHWNWYSNVKKCPDMSIIQCYASNIPEPREREGEGATKPRKAISIGFYENGQYKIVYGEFYNKETEEWSWMENDISDLVDLI